jgi:hypothetical protein
VIAGREKAEDLKSGDVGNLMPNLMDRVVVSFEEWSKRPAFGPGEERKPYMLVSKCQTKQKRSLSEAGPAETYL